MLKAHAEKLAASHASVGAGKYRNRTSYDSRNDSRNDSQKKLESFKTEIVRNVVESLTKMRSSKSSSGSNPRSKRTKTVQLDNFNVDLFSNMGISNSGEEEDNKSIISVTSDASEEHSLID